MSRPAPLRIKLNDESLRLLGQDPETFPIVHPESLKRYFPVRGAEPKEKLSLVMIVEDAGDTAITPISGADALMKLITNVYLVEYLPPSTALSSCLVNFMSSKWLAG